MTWGLAVVKSHGALFQNPSLLSNVAKTVRHTNTHRSRQHGFLLSQTFSFKEGKEPRTAPIQLALHIEKQLKFRNQR